MNMVITGLGVMGWFGTDSASLCQAAGADTPIQEPAVADTSILTTIASPRDLRRMDHFSQLALWAAQQAIRDAGEDVSARTGLVMTTGYGPLHATFAMMDSMIEYGPDLASPLAFSQSVHNMPAAGLARQCNLDGPCITLCQFETSMAAGLLVAHDWLASGLVDRVLLGAVDEYAPLLSVIADRFEQEQNAAPAIQRFRGPLADTASFFCLVPEGNVPGYCLIDQIDCGNGASPTCDDDVNTIFFSAQATESNGFCLGTSPTAVGFDLILVALALQGQSVPNIDGNMRQTRFVCEDQLGGYGCWRARSLPQSVRKSI